MRTIGVESDAPGRGVRKGWGVTSSLTVSIYRQENRCPWPPAQDMALSVVISTGQTSPKSVFIPDQCYSKTEHVFIPSIRSVGQLGQSADQVGRDLSALLPVSLLTGHSACVLLVVRGARVSS